MRGWAPIEVVAAIVPWNFPLMLLSWKVGREGGREGGVGGGGGGGALVMQIG